MRVASLYECSRSIELWIVTTIPSYGRELEWNSECGIEIWFWIESGFLILFSSYFEIESV